MYKMYLSWLTEKGTPMRFNLQAMRKRAGYRSAKAFAEHIGMKVGTYTNYEQGKRPLTLEQAWEFADELHCTLDELAGRDFHPPGEMVSDPFERELVDCYRESTVDGKANILGNARGQAALSLNAAESPAHETEMRETA